MIIIDTEKHQKTGDMTQKSLHNISYTFKISEDLVKEKVYVHKILLKQGNLMGCQLLGFFNGKFIIDEIYFNKLIATDILFKTFVFEKDAICAKASEKIPFDLEPRVYFLLEGGVVVYVGMSNSICARIATHVESKAFDKIATFKIKKADLFEVVKYTGSDL